MVRQSPIRQSGTCRYYAVVEDCCLEVEKLPQSEVGNADILSVPRVFFHALLPVPLPQYNIIMGLENGEAVFTTPDLYTT